MLAESTILVVESTIVLIESTILPVESTILLIESTIVVVESSATLVESTILLVESTIRAAGSSSPRFVVPTGPLRLRAETLEGARRFRRDHAIFGAQRAEFGAFKSPLEAHLADCLVLSRGCPVGTPRGGSLQLRG